jgi:hypothetical protein
VAERFVVDTKIFDIDPRFWNARGVIPARRGSGEQKVARRETSGSQSLNGSRALEARKDLAHLRRADP